MRYLSAYCCSSACPAGLMVVDKVYHPYVLPYEKELNAFSVHQSDAECTGAAHRVAALLAKLCGALCGG